MQKRPGKFRGNRPRILAVIDDVADAVRYLAKAENSLTGAGRQYWNGRFDNSANRNYYACFQAAIAALIQAGIRLEKRADRWPHEFVISRFVGDLIHKRHQFPPELRRELDEIQLVRHSADYKSESITEFEAYRALRRTRLFVKAVRQA
ncbi:MAG: HEPN domain-containing protein [Thermomicrobiales bacterium]